MMLRLFSMLVFFCFATLVSAQEKLAWNENRQLAWDVFQSKDIAISSKAAATTFCGISYLLNSSTKKFTTRQVKIETFFVPSKSWAHKDHKTDLVLMHEQSHFDIAELFARRFRKLISDKTMDAKTLQKFYINVYDDYRDYQQDYENVTSHGRIWEKQLEYTAKINDEIKKLSEFKI